MTESDMTSSKLVFIDIDGTLADENHIVPESAKTACARAQANGHKLFICTGRSVPKIERNILDLGFDGVVSVAGAQANIGDKLLFQHLVSPEAIAAITSVPELNTRHSMSQPVAFSKASVARTAFIGVGSLKVAITMVSAERHDAESASAAVPIINVLKRLVILISLLRMRIFFPLIRLPFCLGNRSGPIAVSGSRGKGSL